MIFYQQETWIGLVIASLPAILSVYFYLYTDKKSTALGLLMLSALLLRLLMISLDPFIHDWDERYHALVAKNMISFPFKPMLVMDPVMAYDYLDWSNNHIWLHKQPLFMWQMALSMKLFGVNEIAMRLPSAIMGTILVWLTYDLGRKWIPAKPEVAFVAAFLTTFSSYTLGMISGQVSLEHNDIAFLFYVTASFWAWTNYVQNDFKLKWAVLTGAFIGLAVLNKWLTGYLVMGGWGLYLLTNFGIKIRLQHILHLGIAFLVSLIVFVPWQLYISNAFPVESAIEYQHNTEHFTKDFGHPGDVWTHLKFLSTAYHWALIAFALIGMYAILRSKEINKKIAISFLAMIIVVFAFFSILVKTKMPAFVFPVSPLIFTFMAFGVFAAVNWLAHKWTIPTADHQIMTLVVVITLGILNLKPGQIANNRSLTNEGRNAKISNSLVYKNLPDSVTKDRIIINCKSFENVEVMFHKDTRAYHWYPPENILDSLQQLGHKFAVFRNTANQSVPAYIYDDPEIIMIEEPIR